MKIIAFNGSPHQQGNTYRMLCAVLGALQEQGVDTELIHIGKRNVFGCMGCGDCRKKGPVPLRVR